MKNLIEKIASYQRATQSLIDKTNEYENFIKANIPFELWARFGIKKFGDGQHTGRHISVGGKLIPGFTEKFGKSFYWGGDFNYYTEHVTGRELIEWSKTLPSLINKATEYIDTLTKEADSICAEISVPQ